MMNEIEHINELAKELVGNWKKWPSFAWHDKPDDCDQWCIVYTKTRDSSILDESNHDVINKELQEYIGYQENGIYDCEIENHSHWAYGYAVGFSIRVFNSNGEITEAFKTYAQLKISLDNYLVLDEHDFSEREFNEANRVWKDCYNAKERIEYVRKNRSQFEFNSFEDMINSILRGNCFCGYASELINR